MARWRRRYYEGSCDDCGPGRRVTNVFFWVSGMAYTVCAECIKPYRRQLLTHTPAFGPLA